MLTASRDYINTVIKVRVGEDKEEIYVHKDLICYWSPLFFEPAFKGPWKEGKDGVMDLESIQPDVFKNFVQWLYTQSLYMGKPKDSNELTNEPLSFELIVRLYSFAQMIQIPHLQNDCIDALRNSNKVLRWTPVEQLSWIWENTAEGCSLQRYMVDRLVWACKPTVFDKYPSYFTNTDCCRAIMSALALRAGGEVAESPLNILENYYVVR